MARDWREARNLIVVPRSDRVQRIGVCGVAMIRGWPSGGLRRHRGLGSKSTVNMVVLLLVPSCFNSTIPARNLFVDIVRCQSFVLFFGFVQVIVASI